MAVSGFGLVVRVRARLNFIVWVLLLYYLCGVVVVGLCITLLFCLRSVRIGSAWIAAVWG